MKRGGIIEVCALIGLLLSTGAMAASDTSNGGQPYDGIVERNVFNLHAPPPPVNPADLVQHTPPPKITFTGITTILGKKLAFLTVPAAKPGALPESMMLAEGQAQNDVEVKTIDEKAGIVKVVNHGESQTLDFDHDGVKGAPAAPNPTMLPPPAPPPPNVMPGNVIRPLRSLPPRSSLSPEEQVALIEVQRVKYQQENNPISKLLPPTEMTPDANGAAPQ